MPKVSVATYFYMLHICASNSPQIECATNFFPISSCQLNQLATVILLEDEQSASEATKPITHAFYTLTDAERCVYLYVKSRLTYQ